MPIKFECSDCGTALRVKDQFAGRKIRCPHCDTVNQVPADNEADDDDEEEEVVSRSRSSSTSSRSKPARRSPPRSRRPADDDEQEARPRSSRPSKKKVSKKSKSASGGKVPVWAIVAGSSLVVVVLIAVVVFLTTKPSANAANGQVAGGDQAKPAEQAKNVQAHVQGPGRKIRMKFEMPLNWTSEGSIEDDMFPWATMKGQGQTIKLSTNRSLLGGAESMTTLGGEDERLKASHTSRGAKLQAENTDWVDGPLSVHTGKQGPVVWSNYEYKGVFSKGYGIRATVNGPVMPCSLMLECSESARDKWRPTLLAIAESIYFVELEDNGEEKGNDFEPEPGDEMPNPDQGEANQPEPDQAEMNGDSEELP